MNKFNQFLETHKADSELQQFADNLTPAEFHETCIRGDWMLWLFNESNPDSLKEITLAKGHCANTVRHLMKDERSTKAVDAAIAFGEGLIGREELRAAYAGAIAYAVHANAYATYTDAVAYISTVTKAAADTYAYAYAVAYYSARAAEDEKKKLQTADICRKYLPLNIWNIAEKEGDILYVVEEAPVKSNFTIKEIKDEIVSLAKESEVEIIQIKYLGNLFTKNEVK